MQSGLVSRPIIRLSRVFDHIGCLPPQEKHSAGNKNGRNMATEKNQKIGSFNEPDFHVE